MAVPKTTQTRHMDDSVQATQRTTQVTPSLHHFLRIEHLSKVCCQITICADIYNKNEKEM